jgi:hypothetical protein
MGVDSLLRAFAATFEGQPYIHRRSYIGNLIASHLYEDLLQLGRSRKFADRVNGREIVVNTLNRVTGREGRRGDGTLGVLPPRAIATVEGSFKVTRGPVATLEIGAEVKIIATKMIAQIDRVMSDLRGQADVFRSQSSKAITVGIAAVNFADEYTGYEGQRRHVAKAPPSREGVEVVRRLNQFVRPHYDEFIILRFRATNGFPFPFSWVSQADTGIEYGSALVRISNEYEARY